MQVYTHFYTTLLLCTYVPNTYYNDDMHPSAEVTAAAAAVVD